MDEACSVPLVGQAWLLAGFDFDYDPALDTEELFAPAGETPLLLLSERFRDDPAEADRAFCVGIVRLYVQRYGFMNLIKGIQAWDGIVESLSRPEQAAD